MKHYYLDLLYIIRSMYLYPFEKLEAWKLARKLNVEVYKITSTFPADERFGIVNQIRRASVSICSNLAEGSGRVSKKEQSHFYSIAYSSLLELLNQLIISTDLGWLALVSLTSLRADLEIVSVKINFLKKSTLI